MKAASKICTTCPREFTPSSNHLRCPACRSKDKPMHQCKDCTSMIYATAERCGQCSVNHRRTEKILADEFIGFRAFLSRAKKRGKLGDISLRDLADVWKSQNHICPYSGVTLVVPHYRVKSNPLYTASLDRIESSKPYEKGNIQFVSIAVNNMKHTMSHEDTLNLCELIATHYNKKSSIFNLVAVA